MNKWILTLDNPKNPKDRRCHAQIHENSLRRHGSHGSHLIPRLRSPWKIPLCRSREQTMCIVPLPKYITTVTLIITVPQLLSDDSATLNLCIKSLNY